MEFLQGQTPRQLSLAISLTLCACFGTLLYRTVCIPTSSLTAHSLTRANLTGKIKTWCTTYSPVDHLVMRTLRETQQKLVQQLQLCVALHGVIHMAYITVASAIGAHRSLSLGQDILCIAGFSMNALMCLKTSIGSRELDILCFTVFCFLALFRTMQCVTTPFWRLSLLYQFAATGLLSTELFAILVNLLYCFICNFCCGVSQEDLHRTMTLFMLVLYVRKMFAQNIQSTFQSKINDTSFAAARTLLNTFCDAVVELDSELRFVDSAQTLADLLLHMSCQSFTHRSFSDFLFSEEDAMNFTSHVSVPLQGMSCCADMFSLRLRDSIGNQVSVTVYHACAVDVYGQHRHCLGIQEQDRLSGPVINSSGSMVTRDETVDEDDGMFVWFSVDTFQVQHCSKAWASLCESEAFALELGDWLSSDDLGLFQTELNTLFYRQAPVDQGATENVNLGYITLQVPLLASCTVLVIRSLVSVRMACQVDCQRFCFPAGSTAVLSMAHATVVARETHLPIQSHRIRRKAARGSCSTMSTGNVTVSCVSASLTTTAVVTAEAAASAKAAGAGGRLTSTPVATAATAKPLH